MNLKNKRGTHVGVILSFLIFITFLAFLYSITEPVTRISRDKSDLLGYLKIELLRNFTEDLSTIIVEVDKGGCVIFKEFDEELRGWGIVAKDNEENLLGAYRSKTDTEVNCKEGIIKLYYSREFGNGTYLGCTKKESYEIKIFRTTEEIFESKINATSEYINENITNYEEIKKSLGVPRDSEFGFTFTNSTKDFVTGTKEKNISANVYVEEIPIQYIDNEANIKPGFLNIRVW